MNASLALCRLLALLLSLSAALPTQEPAIAKAAAAGDWRGSIEIPDSPLDVLVVLANEGERWAGKIDIPAQGAQNLPLEAITVAGRKASFRIAKIRGEPTFAGELTADGAQLAGTFTQGGQSFPFTLRRAEAAAKDLAVRFVAAQSWLDETRERFEVPGCAVAVLKDGDLIATLVSGKRDVEHDLPVTKDTLFAIGSSTKAFTTALLATFVDAGKLTWDDPVRRWLPEFELADAALSDRVTLRDLVTHRTGMPRHDLAWYGAAFDRADMVRRLRHLPLSHDLRAEFQYNNLMLLTAGVVAERVGGAGWEELVRQRLLGPLGMPRTGFSVAAMQKDRDHSLPYDRRDDKVVAVPYRDLSAIGPAGSINSSVDEMAHWVSLLLQRGSFGGKELLAPHAVDDLMAPRIPTGMESSSPEIVGSDYASGWFVDVYRGHLRVHHGGNIDGFSAEVSLLPRDGYGFVVLTNMDGSMLPELIARQFGDLALALEPRDWAGKAFALQQSARAAAAEGKQNAAGERVAGTRPSHELVDYAGDYADPGYGALRVSLQDGVLHLDMHGLAVPLEHWHYDVFAGVADAGAETLRGLKFSFSGDVDGQIDGVSAVLDPFVPAIRFARQADERLRDPQFLKALVGTYVVGGQPITLSLQDDLLTVDLPGQHYELEPKVGLVFGLVGLHGYSLRVELDGEGRPTALVFRQPDGVHRATR